MNKSEAIKLFGSAASMARALGVTRGNICHMPEQLCQRDADRVVGAAMRLGLYSEAFRLVDKQKVA